MIDFTPKGSDGSCMTDVQFRLGEFYGFSQISDETAYHYNIPQHWYGMVQAFCPANKKRQVALIEIQMLPAPDFPLISLPLGEWLMLIEQGDVQCKHFEQVNRFEDFNNRLKLVIQATDEHIQLMLDNPELMEAWKIQCLYPYIPFDQRVKATYDWLTDQTDWFDIDPNQLDWIFLVQQLIREADYPTHHDDDDEGGIPADIY